MQITIQIDTDNLNDKLVMQRTADFLRSLSVSESKEEPPICFTDTAETIDESMREKIKTRPAEPFDIAGYPIPSYEREAVADNIAPGAFDAPLHDYNHAADLDSEGLPWDRRIHSRMKSIKADGTWRVARGADPELVQQIKQELRKVMAIPKVVQKPGEFTVSGKQISSQLPPNQKYKITHTEDTSEQEIPLAPKPPRKVPPSPTVKTPMPAAKQVTNSDKEFNAVMTRVAAAMSQKKLTRDQFSEILLRVHPDLTNPMALSHARHLSGAVNAELDKIGDI